MTIRSVAVLGAGTMGAQIAAHFANAGVPALLLDVSADAARDGVKRASALKPDPAFTPDTWSLVDTGSFDADLDRIADVDWVIEAIVERLDAKQALLARVDSARRHEAIVSTNTSGIPVAALAQGRSDGFRAQFLGTHFFNPPRYLRLLELIPTADTDDAVVKRVRWFADHRLGKGVVLAKDSPNFIGNHLALFAALRALERVADGQYTIEEVDAITGPPLGRPKSATFRTLDLIGLDVLAHIVGNLRDQLADEAGRSAFVLPRLVEEMLARGLTGEKAGGGFYKRVRNAAGESEILVLDPDTFEYRPQKGVDLPSLRSARSIEDARERVRALVRGGGRLGAFLRDTLIPMLQYTSRVAPQIAYSPDDVDRVMRWGFGWELGPFELSDAIGVEGVEKVRDGLVPPAAADLQILRSAKERSRTLRHAAGASLVDLGDGVLCVEFHSKMNALGADALELLRAGVTEASANFAALIIGNEADHFSAGADLTLVLRAAVDRRWDEIDAMIRTFQQTTGALRYVPVPVVVAPAGLTLGGGCEITLHAACVQAAAEAYIGLVETGVGLIPAAGGTKEMVARAAGAVPPNSADLLPPIQRAFETIAFATVSTSAADARRLGYLRLTDGVTMNRERLLADAKAQALRCVADGYQPPPRRDAIRVGGDSVLAPLKLGIHLAHRARRISDHDAVIGRTLATVMAGGTLPHPAIVNEQYLLDLEREAFLRLIGERKTQERIQHTLKTGKPLRN